MLVFWSRGFTNAITASLFGLILRITDSDHLGHAQLLALASSAAFGIWTRVDFLAFLLPIGLSTLWRLRNRVAALALAAIAFAASVGTLIVVDSLYFGQWTIVPLNLLRYNLQPQNTAQHGAHPRWLHVAVNLPILFGIGGPIALARALRRPSRP